MAINVLVKEINALREDQQCGCEVVNKRYAIGDTHYNNIN